MAGSTKYLRYILLSLVCLIIIFFVSSSSEIPRTTYKSASDLLKDSQSRWRNSPAEDVLKARPIIDDTKQEKPVMAPAVQPAVPKLLNPQDAPKPAIVDVTPSSEADSPVMPVGVNKDESPYGDDASNSVPAAGSAGKPAKSGQMKATFVTLARNSETWDLARSIRQVEDRFNHQFHYDWVFLNDQPFDETFINVTTALVSGKTKYGLIPTEHWGFPDFIDQERAKEVREDMGRRKIIYGDSISYRHMCRYESGFFFRHPLMMDYEWYWRVEPSIELFCNADYDVFKYMADHGKKYSWVLSLHEYTETIPTLWNSVKSFMSKFPQHIAKDNSMFWLSEDNGATYNGCHFWSNFEVGSLNWLRSPAYLDYFNALDRDGGFFYERWGDAPVHSIAAALTLPKDQIHFFEDISYYHVPFTHCPTSEKLRREQKCHCDPSKNFDWVSHSCTKRFFDMNQMTPPEGWENQS